MTAKFLLYTTCRRPYPRVTRYADGGKTVEITIADTVIPHVFTREQVEDLRDVLQLALSEWPE